MAEIALDNSTAPLAPALTPPPTTSPSAASDPIPSTPTLPSAMLEKASSPLTAMPSTPVSNGAGTPISPKWVSPRRAARMAAENAEAGPSTSPRPAPDMSADADGDVQLPLEVNAEDQQPKYLQPASFYPLHNGIRPATSAVPHWQPINQDAEEFSPEDDPLALRGIPIFRPTMEEFKDFEAYVERTAPWGSRSGIVKIIPPAEWIDTLPPMDRENLSHVKIKNPIQQNMMGSGGVFRATNIEKNKNRPLSVKEWFDKCQAEAFVGPSPRVVDRDSKEAAEMRRQAMAEKKAMMQRKKEEKLRRKAERDAEREAQQVTEEQAEVKEEEGLPALDPSSSASSHSSPDPVAKTPEAEDIEPWYRETDLSQAWLPRNTSPEDYTPEACKMLQDKFWKNMGLGEPSWYGADLMQGSLFAEKETPWNVAHLPNLLNRIQCVVPGVNEPYLYFGMWRAQFPWHVEDMDLFSINYIHFGAPKFWYAIPQGQADLFERRLKDWFPQDAQQCDQFLRHKSCAISPTQLEKNGIRANMLVHNQGEFVITYPRGYHAGFNMGFNCAESVNFALDSWIELGRKAKYCQCVDHSVRIDVDKMLDAAADAVAQPAPRKRRRAKADEEGESKPKRPRKKKLAKSHYDVDGVKIEDINAISATERQSAKSRVKLEDGEEGTPRKPRAKKEKEAKIVAPPPVYPCLFCPSLEEDALVPVQEYEGFDKSLGKNRTAPYKAHFICAQAIPEVGIEEVEVAGQKMLQVVGLENIEKARWALKCAMCHDKSLATSGVKVQCTKGKCPRAFHASCARNSDEIDFKVFAVAEDVPNPDAAEPAYITQNVIKIQLLCPQHNPAMKDIRERKKAEQLKAKVMALLPGSLVKIRQHGGTIYQMKLVAVNPETRMVEVELDNGHTGLYPWDKIEWKNVEARTAENEYGTSLTPAREYVTSRKNRDAAPATAPAPLTTPAAGVPIQQAARQALSSGAAPPKQAQHFRPYTTQQPFRSTPLDPSAQPFVPSVLTSHKPAAPPLGPPPFPSAYAAHERDRSVTSSSSSAYHPLASNGHSLPPLHSIVSRGNAQPGYYSGYDRCVSRLLAVGADGRSRENSGSSAGSLSHSYYPSQPAPPHMLPPQAYPHHPQRYAPAPVGHYPRYNAQPAPYGYQFKATAFGTGNHPPVFSRPSDGASSSAGAPPPPIIPPSASPQGSAARPSQSPVPGDTSTAGIGKIDLGLDRMIRLMSLLPPLTTPAIHLAGTNGKGSVTAFLSSMLSAAGLRVATYNSPYLIEPRDAIQIDGQPPPLHAFTAARAHIASINAAHNIQATTFELVTATAFFLIQESGVDVMIIECGMGGATDATNVIPPEINLASGLTAVGLDHTSFLGDTVYAITRNKAAIAARGSFLIVGDQDDRYPGVAPVAAEVALSRGARFIKVPRVSSSGASRVLLRPFTAPPPASVSISVPVGLNTESVECEYSLPGRHQADNLALAVTILVNITRDPRALSIQPKLASVTIEHIATGAKGAVWKGRLSWMQWRDMPLLVDGAHNTDSARTLRHYLDAQAISRVRWVIGLSASADKTPESVLAPLLRTGDEVWAMEFDTPIADMPWIKAVPYTQLAQVASSILGPGGEEPVHPVTRAGPRGLQVILDQLAEEYARNDSTAERVLTVLCGSLYLVAEYYRLART